MLGEQRGQSAHGSKEKWRREVGTAGEEALPELFCEGSRERGGVGFHAGAGRAHPTCLLPGQSLAVVLESSRTAGLDFHSPPVRKPCSEQKEADLLAPPWSQLPRSTVASAGEGQEVAAPSGLRQDTSRGGMGPRGLHQSARPRGGSLPGQPGQGRGAPLAPPRQVLVFLGSAVTPACSGSG